MNTEDRQKVKNTVSMSLQGLSEITHNLIIERVKLTAEMMNFKASLNDISEIVKGIEASMQFKMDIGHTLKDAAHKSWINIERENIEWYYWNRYKQMLIKDGFGKEVVSTFEIVTDDILDLLQNPKDLGKWSRRGLVVGHVQSGKTANYSGVICKALDSGYKVIIVLAGLLNSLRKQTQQRIDSSVIGLDSSLMLDDISLHEKVVGVGEFACDSWPVSITTANSDFSKSTATKQQAAIKQYRQPLVFVIKKNVSILKNLIDWFKNNNFNLSEYPLLLIDDEADHASINTKNDDLDPTKTNNNIRELLALFDKNVYLGYTATPFANIFIDPDTPEEMTNDLFPENFIKSLDPPSNYMGSKRIFIEKNPNIIRLIKDYDDFMPLGHKKEDLPQYISGSLKNAIGMYVLVCAIRILRGSENAHNSMLVNVSRFTDIQSKLRLLINDYLVDLRNAVSHYYALSESKAMDSKYILNLKHIWDEELSDCEFNWGNVQSVLNTAVQRIEVIEVNGSKQAEKEIDYSRRSYPLGRHLIAVGGLSLSRGITLEGLSITYFLRNSIMYDTLMQMGRWFGYRPNYEDLCRVYMISQAKSWYEYIAEATEELRNEFERMERHVPPKTPKDFGLCVRNHPGSLLVTARNKMRSAQTVVRDIEITGKLIETNRLFTSASKVEFNLNLFANIIRKLKMGSFECETPGRTDHRLWKNIPYKIVSDFVESFQNHPESIYTDSSSVKNYVESLAVNEGIDQWNVLIISIKEGDKDLNISIKQDELKDIGPGIRKTTQEITSGIMFSSRKLASEGVEFMDIEGGKVREVPLLMLHLLDCRLSNQNKVLYPNGVAAYGISFPGEKNGNRINRTATYQVNTTWMREQYGKESEDDEDMGSDI